MKENMKLIKKIGLFATAAMISHAAPAYELVGNYCWVNHDYRLIMPASGPVVTDNFYPTLRDAIVEVERSAGVMTDKEAGNNCKIDNLFLRHPRTKALLAKIMISSEIACKTVKDEAKK